MRGGHRTNVEVCRRNVLDSIGIVTYLNPVIGHHHGDLVGRECARSGRSVREVVLEMGLLDEATVDELLSPENLPAPPLPRPLRLQRHRPLHPHWLRPVAWHVLIWGLVCQVAGWKRALIPGRGRGQDSPPWEPEVPALTSSSW